VLDWKNPASWSVLVVDDEPDNLELVAIFLGFKGAVVKTAHNGQEALNTLKTFKPNLILLDLSMPQMSGWDVHAALQANPETKDIWTIALTAHAMVTDRQMVQDAGFNGYLTKPINLPTLLEDLEHSGFNLEPAQE
jgi:CheY-like chemotaxis protein